jgi:hypothetical protein
MSTITTTIANNRNLIFIAGFATLAGVVALIALPLDRTVVPAELPAVPGAQAEAQDGSQRAADASAARWVAMGEYYTAQAEAGQRAILADAARYTGLAEHFGEPTGSSQRAADAFAARWNAMGKFYQAQADEGSAQTGN